jgi:UDP-N-acetylglucosamine 2-epimerase (non-hydrolysing)
LVIVQGDTASAYAGAIAASGNIPVAHVEAGIRSGDDSDPWPEEIFRREIDTIASQNGGWKFAPTEHAKCNLLDWWHTEVTGNPGIDALYAHTQPTTDVEGRVLVTLHRRESFGAPLMAIVQGLEQAAQRYEDSLAFVWPTHPNPGVQAVLEYAPHVLCWPPQPTVAFANLLAHSRCVVTDSGGVQEEAAALGVPCVVARDKTDRPESVDVGLAKVAGRTAAGILEGLEWALSFTKRPDPSHCFGDGHAAPRIVDHLLTAAD